MVIIDASTGWESIPNINPCKEALAKFKDSSDDTPEYRKSKCFHEKQDILKEQYDEKAERRAKKEV